MYFGKYVFSGNYVYWISRTLLIKYVQHISSCFDAFDSNTLIYIMLFFRLLRSFAIIFYIRISHLCLCFYCFFSICHQKETMLQLRKAFVTIYVKNMDIDNISCISQEQSNKCHIVCSFIGRNMQSKIVVFSTI